MGVIARLSAGPGPLDDFWYTPIWSGAPVQAGVNVSPETAMRVTTVYACVRILAETVAQLPLHLYRRRDDGGKERADDHPLYLTLRRQPNPWQGSYTWRETLQGHVGLRGTAYSIIRPGRRGAVDSLIPVRPDLVQVEQLDTYRLRFKIKNRKGLEDVYTQDEIFRVPGLSDDGIVGLSPVGVAREAIGLAMAAEGHGARFFNNNARPGGILSTEQKLPPEKKSEIRDAWERAHAGVANSNKVGVLDMGLTWTQVGMSMEDAQFLETRKFQRTEIAALFRIPPHMIGDLERATFSNIEQQSIDFVVFTMLPWLKRWEEAITRDLIPAEDQEEYFPEFDVRGLLRGESEKRAAYYNALFNVGALSQNDIRRLENENPIEGGDRYFVPLNMAPSDRVDEVLDAQTAPPEPAPARSAEARVGIDAQAFALLVEDVAERVAAAEVRGLESRADKAAEDRARFNAWAAEFYQSHAAYVRKAVKPLASAWGMATDTAPQTEALVEAIVSNGSEAVQATPDVPALVAAWHQIRAGSIAAIIVEVLNGQG